MSDFSTVLVHLTEMVRMKIQYDQVVHLVIPHLVHQVVDLVPQLEFFSAWVGGDDENVAISTKIEL